MEKEIEVLKGRLQKAIEVFRKQENEINESKNLCENLKSEIETLKNKISELEIENSALSENNKELKNEEIKNTELISDLKNNLSEITKNNNELNLTIENLTDKLNLSLADNEKNNSAIIKYEELKQGITQLWNIVSPQSKQNNAAAIKKIEDAKIVDFNIC